MASQENGHLEVASREGCFLGTRMLGFAREYHPLNVPHAQTADRGWGLVEGSPDQRADCKEKRGKRGQSKLGMGSESAGAAL